MALEDREKEEGIFIPKYGVDALTKLLESQNIEGLLRLRVQELQSFGKRNDKGKYWMTNGASLEEMQWLINQKVESKVKEQLSDHV